VEAEERAIVRITDQGCGMNETDLAAVFKPYTTNKKGGMGFGLAYTKKIVEQIHRGWVHANSERGSGTTIEFVLPMFQDREEVERSTRCTSRRRS
jgi:signal transduction histidine kinase